MAFPDYVAGQLLTADDLNQRAWKLVTKSATQSKTSDTSAGDVTDMTIPVLAGQLYEYELNLLYQAGDVGDIAVSWTLPTTMAMQRAVVGYAAAIAAGGTTAGGAVVLRSTTAISGVTVGGTGNPNVYKESGFTTIAATVNGNMQLQYAQAVSNATATQVLLNSFLRYRRIA